MRYHRDPAAPSIEWTSTRAAEGTTGRLAPGAAGPLTSKLILCSGLLPGRL
ncbi:hypothetical protein GCM10009780_65150 [Actinomadura alba]